MADWFRLGRKRFIAHNLVRQRFHGDRPRAGLHRCVQRPLRQLRRLRGLRQPAEIYRKVGAMKPVEAIKVIAAADVNLGMIDGVGALRRASDDHCRSRP